MVHFLPPRAEHNSTACVLRSIKTSFYGCRQRRRLSSTRGEELAQVKFQFVSFSPRWVAIALITKFGLGMMGDLDTMRNEAFRKKVMRCNEKEYCYAGYSDTLQMERFICLSKSKLPNHVYTSAARIAIQKTTPHLVSGTLVPISAHLQ